MISHVEVLLESPRTRRFVERICSFARVTLMDRVGTGLSDPLDGPPDLAGEAEDVLAVLDATGAERTTVLAYATSAVLGVQLAALHPERVRGLVLYAGMYRTLADEGYDWARGPEERRAALEDLLAHWGTGHNLERIAPSLAADPVTKEWLARMERSSASPRGMRALADAFGTTDVRDLLPTLRVPTLVMHRTDDALIDVRHSRYAAAQIPGARYVELPGSDSLPSAGDPEAIVGELEEFLTGSRTGRSRERQLLTIAFTDVVGATAHAARLGDAAWRELLRAHDEAVRPLIARFGGEEVKTIGDSFLVAFPGAPSQAVRFAAAALEAVRPLGLQLRAGLHTGECERLGDDVGGMAVHIAARVVALAAPDEVLASGTTYGTVVGSGLAWAWRGEEELKGVPGPWPLFRLAEPARPAG
ncbi:MAG: adenylate/guanylate cyclase protein [Solirubrobacterales bacterium]|jgi:class 3 adenylate cyclase|nr:adenylate/guanylate cyclase protein [Solirubrobacterales bacterium]